jgi:hypothetical protein
MALDKSETSISTYDIIFSCSICQTSASELYGKLSSVTESTEDNIYRRRLDPRCLFWITACGHGTCSTHLDSGGMTAVEHVYWKDADLYRRTVLSGRDPP